MKPIKIYPVLISMLTISQLTPCSSMEPNKGDESPPKSTKNVTIRREKLEFDAETNRFYFGNPISSVPGYKKPNYQNGPHYTEAAEGTKIYDLARSNSSVYVASYDDELTQGLWRWNPMGSICKYGAAGFVAGMATSGANWYDYKTYVINGIKGAVFGALSGLAIDYYSSAARKKSSSESILGQKDRRKRVAKPDEWPNRVHGHLQLGFGNGVNYIGTGTLIGTKYVLTAGHNLFDRDSRKLVESVTFFPGRDSDSFPWVSRAERICVHPLYQGSRVDLDAYENDIGLIKLEDDLRLGYFGVNDLQQPTVNVTGYPANPDNGRSMYTMNGGVVLDCEVSGLCGNKKHQYNSPNRVFYDIDTWGGQSGSGVWVELVEEAGKADLKKFGDAKDARNLNYYCVAVHTYGVDKKRKDYHNSGTRLNKDKLKWIEEILASKEFLDKK